MQTDSFSETPDQGNPHSFPRLLAAGRRNCRSHNRYIRYASTDPSNGLNSPYFRPQSDPKFCRS
ncbi:hypothetical protein CA51_34820 [Rosistilla oblonga]|uniref:Uncharacterized protein n=1 Tax=Rosistilla oblonga TaxID=2527990 RepID=A0A518IYR2_9BACT|nr:hypothetical protein CA51_34820 [Rosistilla oblonga]QDV58217.1 hypothetical protein Mal33_42340 [Rosistilla oblonga]